MAELEIPELPGRPLLEEQVKNYPKVQWLLDKYADKAYPIIDKHDIEAVLTELLDDMDRWKGAYKTMKINFNNECDSHAADALNATSIITCDGISNSVESNPPPKPVAFFDHRKEPDCTMEYQVYDKQEADAYIQWLEQKAGIL